MTLQIGMLATDGIVVVGDTWQYVEPKDVPWYGYHSSKIKIAENNRIAVACAHDMDASFAIAKAIFQRLSEPKEARSDAILEIGGRLASGTDSECLIAFCDPWPSLYRFVHAKGGEQKCEEILSGMAIGDHGNPACFWITRFHRGGLSCQQLERLAALAVVSAGELSNGSIGGLEAFVCRKSGIRLWSRAESESMQAEMKDLENQFVAAILGS
jgi:hypothetical protein